MNKKPTGFSWWSNQERNKPSGEINFASKPTTCGQGLHFRVPARTLKATRVPSNSTFLIMATSQIGEETPPFPKKMAKCGTGRHIKIPKEIEDKFDRNQYYQIRAKRI